MQRFLQEKSIRPEPQHLLPSDPAAATIPSEDEKPSSVPLTLIPSKCLQKRGLQLLTDPQEPHLLSQKK